MTFFRGSTVDVLTMFKLLRFRPAKFDRLPVHSLDVPCGNLLIRTFARWLWTTNEIAGTTIGTVSNSSKRLTVRILLSQFVSQESERFRCSNPSLLGPPCEQPPCLPPHAKKNSGSPRRVSVSSVSVSVHTSAGKRPLQRGCLLLPGYLCLRRPAGPYKLLQFEVTSIAVVLLGLVGLFLFLSSSALFDMPG